MKRRNLKISLLLTYRNHGRTIYFILFISTLGATVLSGIKKNNSLTSLIYIDIAFILVGLLLEAAILNYSQKGTAYIETNRSTNRYDLNNIGSPSKVFYVLETDTEYSFQIATEAYKRNCSKGSIDIEQSSSIKKPFAEITVVEKTSQKAENEYGSFAVIGDKNKIETTRLILKNINSDISSNYIDIQNK